MENKEEGFQLKTWEDRVLSETEQEKLSKETVTVSEFHQVKLEKEAQKNWDKFYNRNATKFFKDRHWTLREFVELASVGEGADRVPVILEVGCGVGNFFFPLHQDLRAMAGDSSASPSVVGYACDFSPRAVTMLRGNPSFDTTHCSAFVCDVTQEEALSQALVSADRPRLLTDGPLEIDVATLIFVLSAIHPDKMRTTLHNIYSVLRPGGRVLLRDYGLYDHAQLRFGRGSKLANQLYVRQDGTRSYFFSLAEVRDMLVHAGFQVERVEYVHRRTVNKREGLSVPRVFVQAVAIRPLVQDTVCDEPAS